MTVELMPVAESDQFTEDNVSPKVINYRLNATPKGSTELHKNVLLSPTVKMEVGQIIIRHRT